MEYPDKFDLNHFNLSSLFINAALALDNQITKGRNKTDYTPVHKLAQILRETSRELRIATPSNVNRSLVLFLNEFYPFDENIMNTAKVQVKELIDLSEELMMVHGLPKKRVEPLRDICSKLSEAVSKYYAIEHSY